jgi:ACR3 family arsenite efflux pump ArsB
MAEEIALTILLLIVIPGSLGHLIRSLLRGRSNG